MSAQTPQVIGIGETMLMLAPPAQGLLEDAPAWQVYLAGAEANVLIGLARLGINTAWIGKLVDNPLGRRIANETRKYGVDTSRVVWTNSGKTGLLFCEFGVPPRPYLTLYDRENSVASNLISSELDWAFIAQAKLVHLTGITPALSETCRSTTLDIVKQCSSNKILVSFDVNYRSLLWSVQTANTVLRQILPFVDILFVSQHDAEKVLMETSSNHEQVLRDLQDAYGIQVVIMTLGAEGAIGLGRDLCYAPSYAATTINRLGAGDAFVSGFLYGFLRRGLDAGLQYGCAMASLKHTIPHNYPLITLEQVETIIGGSETQVIR